MVHSENHRLAHIGWLRAAVLGANDGTISTASLMIGVLAANPNTAAVIATGVAALVAGAGAMAAGEYVSVQSQADAERAAIQAEAAELAANPAHELAELKGIYIQRGLSPDLAAQVAAQLMAHDPLAAHLRDELGLSAHTQARPVQAAWTSVLAFSIGAALPIATALIAPRLGVAAAHLPAIIALVALCSLGALGALAAASGGASPVRGALRVMAWGSAAMGLTALVGHFFAVAV